MSIETNVDAVKRQLTGLGFTKELLNDEVIVSEKLLKKLKYYADSLGQLAGGDSWIWNGLKNKQTLSSVKENQGVIN